MSTQNSWHIDRRTMLKGVGAALALPWLEAMSTTAYGSGGLDKPPLRMACLFMPNGVVPENWTPPGDDEDYELTPMLKSLKNVQQDILLLENLWHKQTTGRNGHWAKVPAWLSGGYVVTTSGLDLDTGGTSLDQLAAKHIGGRTPLPSLELGIDKPRSGVDTIGGGFTRIYGSHMAWRDPHTPVPKEIIPRLAFDRLFRTTSAPSIPGLTLDEKKVAQSLQGDDTSVLDLVMEDAKSLERKISTSDRAKLDEYLESVRSIEQRIEASLKPQMRWINKEPLEVPRPSPGIPKSHGEHVRLMLDIMTLAFWTDTTRIGTFMFGDAQSGKSYSFLDDVNGSFHGLSHHREEKDKRDQYERIGTWHVEQFAAFIERVKALDEGGTALLDNSMILFGSSLKDGNRHDNHNLPIILAGRGCGSLKPGRRLRAEEDTPLCNLHLSMLHRLGIEVDSFGDSTGPLTNLS